MNIVRRPKALQRRKHYKTETKHKNDQPAEEKNAQLDELYITRMYCTHTHTNQPIFSLHHEWCVCVLSFVPQCLTRILNYNFCTAASANWDGKKNIPERKFNFANVNAKSNCFGTLTICVQVLQWLAFFFVSSPHLFLFSWIEILVFIDSRGAYGLIKP